MLCGAKNRAGSPCKKHSLDGKTRCRLHGGLSLSGKQHWNYQHGQCTKAIRKKIREGRDQLRMLVAVGNLIGIFEPTPRKRR